MLTQSDLFDNISENSSRAQLPEFPSFIRYYDDFDRQYRTLPNINKDRWIVFCNGNQKEINYELFEISIRNIIKLCFCDILVGKSTTTVINYYNSLRGINQIFLMGVLNCAVSNSPPNFARQWNKTFLVKLSRHEGVAVRHILHWLARWEVAQWRQADADLIRQLPGHELEKYKSVREGVAGVEPRVASKIVEFIDDM